MYEPKDIQQAMSHLHASATTLREVYNKMENKKTYRRYSRQLAAVTVVVVLALALGVTASATGMLSYFQGQPKNLNRTDRDEGFYDQAAELSDKTPQSGSVTDGSFFTVEESYYDGEELILAYSLESTRYPVDYSFGPEHEFFEKLTLVPAGREHVWYQDLSEQEYNDIINRLHEYGQVGFILKKTDLGDHITLADGADIGPFIGGPSSEDKNKIVLEPQLGLPDAAKNQDALDMVFKLKTYEAYLWLEGDNVWYYYPEVKGEEVSFTLDNVTK